MNLWTQYERPNWCTNEKWPKVTNGELPYYFLGYFSKFNAMDNRKLLLAKYDFMFGSIFFSQSYVAALSWNSKYTFFERMTLFALVQFGLFLFAFLSICSIDWFVKFRIDASTSPGIKVKWVIFTLIRLQHKQPLLAWTLRM